MNAAAENLHWQVRPMRLADIVRVEEIEQATYPFPWSLGIFRDCLKAGHICRVFDTSSGLAAYSVVSIGAGEAHILNFCVAHDRRRQKVGRRFLREIVTELSAMEILKVFLEVRPSNVAAQALYLSEGFEQIGIRRDYYPVSHGREDAWVFARVLRPRED